MFDEITKSVVLSGTECDCHEVSAADGILSLSFEQTFSKECLDRSAILRAAKVVIVPRCVRRLGAGCFELSEALECVSFQLGSQLESIGERCFYKCALLKRVEGWLSEYVRPMSVSACLHVGHALRATQKHLLRKTPGVVQGTGSHCFSGCTRLGHIEIPANVEIIAAYCFGPSERSPFGAPRADQCCSSLARVTF